MERFEHCVADLGVTSSKSDRTASWSFRSPSETLVYRRRFEASLTPSWMLIELSFTFNFEEVISVHQEVELGVPMIADF